MVEPTQDPPSVTADGTPLAPTIDGVEIRYQAPLADERGEIVEIYRPSWGVHDAPLAFVYQAMIRPGMAKAWVMHKHQDDRLFLSQGALRVGLFDARGGSPTRHVLMVFTVTDRRRPLIVIPRGVYHGLQNVGLVDAVFINMPTCPYDHADPDKFRLPLKNDLIRSTSRSRRATEASGRRAGLARRDLRRATGWRLVRAPLRSTLVVAAPARRGRRRGRLVVPFKTIVDLMEDLIVLGKDFDVAVAPGATHGWAQRPHYATFLYRKLLAHFDRHLRVEP